MTEKSIKPVKAVEVSASNTSDIVRNALYSIGQVVKHRFHPFRGVVFDVDPTFANTEEWWLSIPEEFRPVKDQPYYHVLAENAETTYIAYVSQQNLLPDGSGAPCRHPMIPELFDGLEGGSYRLRPRQQN
jgi:heat shock protein HspQ